MTRDLVSFLSHAKDWGMNFFSASSKTPSELTLEVYLKTPEDMVLVGRLTCEQNEYVFRYDSDYQRKPISAFPKLDQEYRSTLLWPFFAVRIPPLDREDMREEIANRSLGEDQVLEILGSVAKISVANPYEFRLR